MKMKDQVHLLLGLAHYKFLFTSLSVLTQANQPVIEVMKVKLMIPPINNDEIKTYNNADNIRICDIHGLCFLKDIIRIFNILVYRGQLLISHRRYHLLELFQNFLCLRKDFVFT